MGYQKESKFITEWLMLKFPTCLQWRRVRVGPLPLKELGEMMKITLRWVDAIVWDGQKVHLVEAKLKSDLGAIAQLKEYARLFRETPEFTMFRDAPIEMHLLLPYEWADLVAAAKREGITVDIYKPKWLYEAMGWKWEEVK
jgi:hypothetical protein